MSFLLCITSAFEYTIINSSVVRYYSMVCSWINDCVSSGRYMFKCSSVCSAGENQYICSG